MTFSGRTIRHFSTCAGGIAETEHEPASVPTHAHPQLTLCLVTRGDLGESARGTACLYNVRDLIIRAPGECHANAFGPRGARCFNVTLDPALVEWPAVSSPRGAALPIVGDLRRELRGDVSPLVVEGLLLQLAGELSRGATPRKTVAERVFSIVQERFADHLTIQSIAAELGFHPVHVARAFQIHYGRSVGEAVRDLQIAHAKALLRGSSQLAEVAGACGFADQSHFTRVFRHVTGLTPRRFRLASR